MGVNDYGDSSLRAFNLAVHVFDPFCGKVFRVEIEVLVVALIALISPLNVHPQHVNREVAFSELFVPVNHDGGTDTIPLAKVKAKRVQQGQWYIT